MDLNPYPPASLSSATNITVERSLKVGGWLLAAAKEQRIQVNKKCTDLELPSLILTTSLHLIPMAEFKWHKMYIEMVESTKWS